MAGREPQPRAREEEVVLLAAQAEGLEQGVHHRRRDAAPGVGDRKLQPHPVQRSGAQAHRSLLRELQGIGREVEQHAAERRREAQPRIHLGHRCLEQQPFLLGHRTHDVQRLLHDVGDRERNWRMVHQAQAAACQFHHVVGEPREAQRRAVDQAELARHEWRHGAALPVAQPLREKEDRAQRRTHVVRDLGQQRRRLHARELGEEALRRVEFQRRFHPFEAQQDAHQLRAVHLGAALLQLVHEATAHRAAEPVCVHERGHVGQRDVPAVDAAVQRRLEREERIAQHRRRNPLGARLLAQPAERVHRARQRLPDRPAAGRRALDDPAFRDRHRRQVRGRERPREPRPRPRNARVGAGRAGAGLGTAAHVRIRRQRALLPRPA